MDPPGDGTRSAQSDSAASPSKPTRDQAAPAPSVKRRRNRRGDRREARAPPGAILRRHPLARLRPAARRPRFSRGDSAAAARTQRAQRDVEP